MGPRGPPLGPVTPVDEIPVGVPSLFHTEPKMDDDNAEHLEDNIPRLEMVPRGASSVAFYKERSL